MFIVPRSLPRILACSRQASCLRRLHSSSSNSSEGELSQTGQQQNEDVQEKNDYDKLVEMNKLVDSKYKRSLADMENLRTRLQRELDDSKKFAIQTFCKDLIEVTDVMQIALKQITPDSVGQSNYEGIKMIDKRIRSIFGKHGLVSVSPIGRKFDPYEHQAVFESPDASKEPGTVSEVCKEGWKLHDRVIRPAVVGVYKKPE